MECKNTSHCVLYILLEIPPDLKDCDEAGDILENVDLKDLFNDVDYDRYVKSKTKKETLQIQRI